MKREESSKKEKIISCAECRRLKLKCDRQFPCSSCRRRGLAALCPESSLITRPRKNPQLSKKGTNVVARMSERIKQLEEALESLQTKHSEEPHPLLVEDDTTEAEDENTGLEESIGTLAIDPESGTASFYGHSAGMESYYHHELSDLPKRTIGDDGQRVEALDPIKDSILYPLFISVPESAIREHLNVYLPDHGESRRLRDIYFESAAWMYSSIPQNVVEETIFEPVYKLPVPSVSNPSYPLVHAATLFMSFGIASCLDLRNSSKEDSATSHQNATRYHQLAKAALSGEKSMLENPSLPTIRVLMLMVFYHMLLDENNTPEIVWSLLSLATSIAVNMGLHRSSRAWNLPPSVVEERRSLLWQIVRFNSFQGWNFLMKNARLAFGKPPPLSRQCIDCGISPDQPVQLTDGRVKHGDRYRLELLTSTILTEFAEFVLSSSKRKYSDVILMDRKLRDCAEDVFGSPVGSLNVCVDDLKHLTKGGVMCNFYVLAAKETLIIYLHRNYFVRVCSIPTQDYLRTSRYSPSFFAVLRAAQVIIKLFGFLLEVEPDLPCRFWVFWTHALASAIIVSSVVIQHPRCVLAPEAMVSMEAIYSQLCQWAGRDSQHDRPKRALKTVGQLREKARRALETGVSTNYLNSGNDGIGLGLSLLAGSARVVRSPKGPSSATTMSSMTSATPSSATSSDSPPSAAPVGDLHPTLLEDMNAVLERDMKERRLYFGGNDIPLQNPATTTTTTTSSAGVSVANLNDTIGGISPSQQTGLFQTLMDYGSLNSAISPQMYPNQMSNQVAVSDLDTFRQQQQQQQQQPPVSMPVSQAPSQLDIPVEMLTLPYGYMSPMQQQPQQQQSQSQSQGGTTSSWSDMMQDQAGQGYTNTMIYQPEENYPFMDDDGVWQNLVAGLGITT